MFVTYVPETTDYGLATRKHKIGVNLSVRRYISLERQKNCDTEFRKKKN